MTTVSFSSLNEEVAFNVFRLLIELQGKKEALSSSYSMLASQNSLLSILRFCSLMSQKGVKRGKIFGVLGHLNCIKTEKSAVQLSSKPTDNGTDVALNYIRILY